MPWGARALNPEHGIFCPGSRCRHPTLGRVVSLLMVSSSLVVGCLGPPRLGFETTCSIQINIIRRASLEFVGGHLWAHRLEQLRPRRSLVAPLVGKSWNPSLLKLLASRVALARFVCILSIILRIMTPTASIVQASLLPVRPLLFRASLLHVVAGRASLSWLEGLLR